MRIDIKSVFLFLGIIILCGMAINGYAGDHFGEYASDMAQGQYSDAVGWEKVAGYVLIFFFFLYTARKVFEDFFKK
ncbi:MAG: hypothetical protein HUK40_17565 [Desulfobacter sp.]|nr:hypothetical protein [Desulfobacter sp.]WDP86877.1 MAG: hypothetical protein HUN05_18550 [Desulfobacter sp.]